MPKRVRRVSVVPESVGLSYATPDEEGRITIPSDLRGVFRGRKPPVDVVFCLLARGFVSVYPRDHWPTASERRLLDDAKKLAAEVDPDRLTASQLDTAQLFYRLVACRYLDGRIQESWRLLLPSVVRAWLGVPPLQTKRKGKGQEKRGRPARPNPPGLVVIGNFGNIELWNENDLKSALAVDDSRFKELTTEVNQILEQVRATR